MQRVEQLPEALAVFTIGARFDTELVLETVLTLAPRSRQESVDDPGQVQADGWRFARHSFPAFGTCT